MKPHSAAHLVHSQQLFGSCFVAMRNICYRGVGDLYTPGQTPIAHEFIGLFEEKKRCILSLPQGGIRVKFIEISNKYDGNSVYMFQFLDRYRYLQTVYFVNLLNSLVPAGMAAVKIHSYLTGDPR